MISTQIQLPIFNGFYNNIYEDTIDVYLNSYFDAINQNEIDEDEFEIAIYNDENKIEVINIIAKSIIKNFTNLANKYSNLFLKLNFVKVLSPKEYNFLTDQIICNLKITEEQYKTLITFLKFNRHKFQEYLSKYMTSSEGYAVFVSNNYKDWLVDFNKLQKPEAQLSAMLEFFILSHYYGNSIPINSNLENLKNEFNDEINSLIYSDVF